MLDYTKKLVVHCMLKSTFTQMHNMFLEGFMLKDGYA